MIARPSDRRFRHFVKIARRFGERGLLVVVAFHDRTIEFSDELDAFLRVRVVTDDIAQTNIMGALLFVRIGHDRLERFEIGMNITENGETHRVELAREDRHLSMQLTRRTVAEFNPFRRESVAPAGSPVSLPETSGA